MLVLSSCLKFKAAYKKHKTFGVYVHIVFKTKVGIVFAYEKHTVAVRPKSCENSELSSKFTVLQLQDENLVLESPPALRPQWLHCMCDTLNISQWAPVLHKKYYNGSLISTMELNRIQFNQVVDWHSPFQASGR